MKVFVKSIVFVLAASISLTLFALFASCGNGEYVGAELSVSGQKTLFEYGEDYVFNGVVEVETADGTARELSKEEYTIDSTKYKSEVAGEYEITVILNADKSVKKTFTVKVAEKNRKVLVVTFDTDGGGEINSVEVFEGDLLELPPSPYKYGYIFICWKNGENVFDQTIPITSDLTLKAEYKPAEQTDYTALLDSDRMQIDLKKLTSESLTGSIKLQDVTNPNDLKEISGISVEDNVLSFSQLPDIGDYQLMLEAGEKAYLFNATVATKVISTPEEMTKLFEYADNGTGWSWDGYFVLEKDIDCSGYEIVADAEWTGYYDNYKGYGFQGIFDGRGHVIKNLGVGYDEEHGTVPGIFGTVGINGVIKNVAFENVGKNGSGHSGALALNFYGRLENVFISSSSDFYAPIAYIGPNASFKNVISYGTGYTLKSFAQMVDSITGNISVENVIVIGNTKVAVSSDQNREVYDNIKYYLYNEFYSDPLFKNLDFSAFEKDVWYVSKYGLPVFNSMAERGKTVTVYKTVLYDLSRNCSATEFFGDIPSGVELTGSMIKVTNEYQGGDFIVYGRVAPYYYAVEIKIEVSDAEYVVTQLTFDYEKESGGEFVIDFGGHVSGDIKKVIIDEQEIEFGIPQSGKISISSDLLDSFGTGEKQLVIFTDENIFEIALTVVTKIISTPEEMTKIFEYGNRGGEESGYSYGGYYILANDIDCTGYSINSIANFTGYYDKNGIHGFQGVLDGRGYTVKNLTVNENSEYGTTAGIFGTVGTNGVIKNAAFENIIKNGPDHSGALALNFYGRLENVFISSASDFYAPIAYIGPDAVIKNVVAYGTGWGLKSFTQMSNYDNGNNIQAENILAIGNKDAVNPEHNQAIYNATKYFKNDNYKEDPVFTALNFEEMFDCTENGVWKISESLKIPVMKNSDL